MNRSLAKALFILLSSTCLVAEDFRVQILDTVVADPSASEPVRVNLSYSQGIAILLPEDRSLIAGVEVEVRAPAAVQSRPGSFLEYFFRRTRPNPSKTSVSYSGDKFYWQVLPSRVSHIVQIPLGADSGLKGDPYVTSLPALDTSDFPIVFRLMPAEKGMPEELERAVFQVRVRAIPKDLGLLRLSLKPGPSVPEGAPLSVSVDGSPVADYRSPLVLKAGSHSLAVSGPDVRDEFRSFVVTAGQSIPLTVELKDVTPRLILEYPESAAVDLDGRPLSRESRGDAEGLPLQPGEHTVTFSVGDYEVSRKVAVQRGKTYRVSLLIDMNVTEE